MHHALGGYEGVGHFLNGGGFTFEDEHFEAVVMIEVDVEGRKDQMEMVVLHGGEAVREQADVMIVDQGESADYGAIGLFRGLFDERVTDEVAEGFGAIGVAAMGDVVIEFGEKVGIDGYADAAEVAHLF